MNEILRDTQTELERALHQAEIEGDPWVIGRVALLLGETNQWAGRVTEAAALLRRARQLFVEAPILIGRVTGRPSSGFGDRSAPDSRA